MMATKNKRRKLRNQTFLLGLSLVTIVSFTNCGQPGAIDLKAADQPSSAIQGLDPARPTAKKLVPKSLAIDVNSSTNKKLDVLVVIDNSGSMATEQANMAQRFNTFIDELNGLDWQVGIVTTDVSQDTELRDGRLIPFRGGFTGRVITSQMDLATAKDSFAQTIQRSDPNASGDEQGIAASYRAIERSQVAGSDNSALFRADAALAIVIVTDANESPKGGVATLRNDPAKLISLIKGIAPQKAISINSIIVKSGDKACLSVNGNESYGTVYEAASGSTGGVIGTVCAADYASQLTLIGQTAAGLVNSITLACQPVDANGDGKVDIEIRDPNMNIVSGYNLQGLQIKLSTPLSIGRTNVKYYCLE